MILAMRSSTALSTCPLMLGTGCNTCQLVCQVELQCISNHVPSRAKACPRTPHYHGQDPVFGNGGISMEYVIHSRLAQNTMHVTYCLQQQQRVVLYKHRHMISPMAHLHLAVLLYFLCAIFTLFTVSIIHWKLQTQQQSCSGAAQTQCLQATASVPCHQQASGADYL